MVMFLDFAWIKVNSGLDNNYIKVNLAYVITFDTVAIDVLGGKQILIIKINAQHNALSKAMKNKI